MNFGSMQQAIMQIMGLQHPTAPAIAGIPAGGGNIFFVDGVNGDDDYDGLYWTSPKLTIKAATALCVTNRKDVVFILDYPWNDAVAGEDRPIVLDKSWVTYIGVGTEGYKEPKVGVPGDTAAFSAQGAHRVTLMDLYIGGGVGHGCVEINTYSSGFQVINCKIATFAPDNPAYGIWILDAAPNLVVAGCDFAGIAQGLIGTNGIEVTANSSQGLVRNCRFNAITGIAINLSAVVGPEFKILDNIFVLPSDTKGKAITMAAGSSDNYADGNHAFSSTIQMTKVPYLDLGASHWGLNYYSVLPIMPVTA